MAVERFDPATEENKMVLDHYARYLFAAPLAQGKRVLDVACGPGYGSRLLIEKGAHEVVGADVSQEAVDYAQLHYAHERITYVCQDILALHPDENGTFDVIVCFETLEHVPQPEQTVETLAKLLARDGVLVISVPNEGEGASNNPYHLTTFTQERFLQLLRDHFSVVQPYVQSYQLASSIWAVDEQANVPLQHVKADIYRYNAGDNLQDSDCFIAVCAHAAQITVSPVSVESSTIWWSVDDYLAITVEGRDWLAGQVENWKQIADQRESMIQELQSYVAQLEQGKNWLEEQHANWQTEAERLTIIVQEQQQWIAELEQAKAWHEQQNAHWQAQAEKIPGPLRKLLNNNTEAKK